ncbi:MAG TPA: DUF2510 domain-containing protein [Acidimicrobiales bacterium]|nr:DUF2510 domain-containing protein [Acidimicrobiales bacterium]
MIIFGFRRTVTTMAMLTLACRNGHVAAHRLVKATRWFTLFFVPLIPFNRAYLTVCAHCGTQVGWSKADAEAASHAGPRAPAFAPDPVAPPVESVFPQMDAAPMASRALPLATTPPPAGPPAGWYPDPHGAGRRFWSGAAWTDDVQPA